MRGLFILLDQSDCDRYQDDAEEENRWTKGYRIWVDRVIFIYISDVSVEDGDGRRHGFATEGIHWNFLLVLLDRAWQI